MSSFLFSYLVDNTSWLSYIPSPKCSIFLEKSHTKRKETTNLKINIIFPQGGPDIIFTRKWHCISTNRAIYKEFRETFRMTSESKEIYKHPLEGPLFMILDIYPGVKFQDYRIILLLLFRGTAILFQSSTIFAFQTIINKGF